jgi:hypothetical protein
MRNTSELSYNDFEIINSMPNLASVLLTKGSFISWTCRLR